MAKKVEAEKRNLIPPGTGLEDVCIKLPIDAPQAGAYLTEPQKVEVRLSNSERVKLVAIMKACTEHGITVERQSGADVVPELVNNWGRTVRWVLSLIKLRQPVTTK